MQQSKAVRITGTAMLALTVLFCVLPFLSMLSAALQPQGSMPEGIQFTAHPHWENFIDAWNMANITPLLLNSCILVIVVVPCVVIFCSLGGYAFAQLKVPCKGLIYVLFLVGLTIPFETLVTPLYYEISGMGLLNTRLALILPLIGLNIPFGIVWMRSCFEQMPRDLIEAASIDGLPREAEIWIAASGENPRERNRFAARQIYRSDEDRPIRMWAWSCDEAYARAVHSITRTDKETNASEW